MTSLTIRSLNRFALTNVSQNRLRTALSVIAVALGVSIMVATNTISSAMRDTALGEDQSIVGMITTLTDFMLTIVGFVILAAAGFLIFNAFTMSVTQRRQQIGALRALGMTRRQITRLVITEALIIGGIGTILGLVSGPILGRGIMALMSVVAGQMFVFGNSSLSLSNLVLAAVLGMGVTLLSVLLPAQSAARVSPLAALRQTEAAGVDPYSGRRATVSLASMAAMSAYLLIAPPGAWVKPPMDFLLLVVFAVAWLACLWVILPALVARLGDWTRAPLSRRYGATGRLIADNLQRGRRRVMLTILTLATGLTMIVALTGVMTFFFKENLLKTMEQSAQLRVDIIAPFNLEQGVAALAGKPMAELNVPPEVTQDLRDTLGDRAAIGELYLGFPSELAVLVPNMFSYVTDTETLRLVGAAFFTFTEGDWQSALAIMQNGCGLLVSPLLANGKGAKLGDSLPITTPNGMLDCTIAGIGTGPANVSMIGGKGVKEAFNTKLPIYLLTLPQPNVDLAQYAKDRDIVLARHPGFWAMSVTKVIEFQRGATDSMLLALNGILVLAVAAAALGVVNTTMMSVNERRQELGLLRAVGCTQRQVRAIVAGEAALIGVVGGLLGLVAGIGLTVIIVMVLGANGTGLEVNLWETAWHSVQPALITGIVGLIAAPLIAAAAAWLPARSLLRGTPIQTLTARG